MNIYFNILKIPQDTNYNNISLRLNELVIDAKNTFNIYDVSRTKQFIKKWLQKCSYLEILIFLNQIIIDDVRIMSCLFFFQFDILLKGLYSFYRVLHYFIRYKLADIFHECNTENSEVTYVRLTISFIHLFTRSFSYIWSCIPRLYTPFCVR